jgi:hypothetical protein
MAILLHYTIAAVDMNTCFIVIVTDIVVDIAMLSLPLSLSLSYLNSHCHFVIVMFVIVTLS